MKRRRKVTVDAIRAGVRIIQACAGDADVAHGLEDALWRDVLHAIANGALDPATLAKEALKTRTVVFDRWTS